VLNAVLRYFSSLYRPPGQSAEGPVPPEPAYAAMTDVDTGGERPASPPDEPTGPAGPADRPAPST
jgi:hypothetical protein